MQAFKQKYLFLSAQSYSIDQGEGKDSLTGVSVRYLPTDNLSPVVDQLALERGQTKKGINHVKVSLPLTMLPKLQVLPGLYEATLEMSVAQEKQQVRIVDIELVSAVALSLTANLTDKKAS